MRRICAAIIAMARELKLKVIAEGVENVEQLEFLRSHRCDQVQGYLMSPPIPVADLQRLLRGPPYGARGTHPRHRIGRRSDAEHRDAVDQQPLFAQPSCAHRRVCGGGGVAGGLHPHAWVTREPAV